MARRGNGEGSIYIMADGRWRGAYKDTAGKRRVVTAKTRADAAKLLTSALRDRDKGIPQPGQRETVAAYLNRWLESIKPTIRPRSWQRYEEIVRLHVTPTLGKVALARLTPAQVQGLYSKKISDGLAPASVVKIHVVIHRALHQAERWGAVARNVAALVDRPRITRKETATLSPEQTLVFLAAAAGDRLEALYVLAISTGMRQGELLALRWADVDLEQGSLQVRATLQQRTEGSLSFAEPKTAGSRRQVYLTPSAVAALRRHRPGQAEERLKLGPAWEDMGLVFSNEVGRPIEAGNLLRRSFYPLLKAAGLPRIRFHDLRHTAATLWMGRGENPKIVSEILGHAQVGITLDLYSHVTPAMHRAAATTMESILQGKSIPGVATSVATSSAPEAI